MLISPATRQAIALEATEWFVRMQHLSHGVDGRLAFSEWLGRSPIHIEEFLAVSAVWALVDPPADGRFTAGALIDTARNETDPANIVDFPGHGLHPIAAAPQIKPSQGTTRRWLGVAAGMIFLSAAGLSYYAWRPATEFSTAIGEQRSIGLADGSVVFLNTNSTVRLRWTKAERKIELRQGEARFQVAKNPARPFVVATSEATVRAVGTIFNVIAETKVTQVTVIEGRVNVRANEDEPRWSPSRYLPYGTPGGDDPRRTSKSGIDLSAGENAAVDSQGRIEPSSGPPVERVDAWTARHLVFREETLDKVVAEFNRYHDVPMVVDDAKLAALKINGVFDSNDPETLVAYLKTFETVQTHVAADGSLHLFMVPSVIKADP